MFCGASLSRTLLKANEPPNIAAAPSAISRRAITAPAQLIIRSMNLRSGRTMFFAPFSETGKTTLSGIATACATWTSLVVT